MSRKPLIRLTYLDLNRSDRRIDVMRTLVQAQDEVSCTDVSGFIKGCNSDNIEIAELMLSLDSVRETLVFNEWGEDLYPALGAALCGYGAHIADKSVLRDFSTPAYLATWESIIRKLLHIGVDVHAPVLRDDFLHSFQSESYPCTLSQYGTPLDELFTYTTTAGEAKEVADAWLQILSTEGIDILTYLEKEKALHATQAMFTCPGLCYYYLPRQLVFNLGEAPSVHAYWWIDPECSTFLIRQEFKDTNIITGKGDNTLLEWQQYDTTYWKRKWPIDYPRWSNILEPWILGGKEHATWKRLSERAQERADRRWHKKARKAARLTGARVHSSMPGAWPE